MSMMMMMMMMMVMMMEDDVNGFGRRLFTKGGVQELGICGFWRAKQASLSLIPASIS